MKLTIYPQHCNATSKSGKFMIHGGEVLKIADQQAAITIKEYAEARYRVEFKDYNKFINDIVYLTVATQNCAFYKGAELGDVIEFTTEIIPPKTDHKISCTVLCSDSSTKELLFSCTFAFCTFTYNIHKEKYVLFKHKLNK